MRSTITAQGQTVIPAEIRRHFQLTSHDRLEWIIEDSALRIVPVKQNALKAFRGQGNGGSTARLLKERILDREKE